MKEEGEKEEKRAFGKGEKRYEMALLQEGGKGGREGGQKGEV